MESKILLQLARYCAYQERCFQEVKQKMKDLGVPLLAFPAYLAYLTENNYLHEKRFVELYVRSKLNQKNWGRNKILFELRKRGISAELLENAWNEVDETMYFEKLESLLIKKKEELKDRNRAQKFQKCYAFGLSKGFESDLVKQVLNRVLPNTFA